MVYVNNVVLVATGEDYRHITSYIRAWADERALTGLTT